MLLKCTHMRADLPNPGADLSPPPPAPDPAAADPTAAGAEDAAVAAERTRLKKLRVPELKELLKARGDPVGGKKDDLIDRLLAPAAASETPQHADAASDSGSEDGEQYKVSKILERRVVEKLVGLPPTSDGRAGRAR